VNLEAIAIRRAEEQLDAGTWRRPERYEAKAKQTGRDIKPKKKRATYWGGRRNRECSVTGCRKKHHAKGFCERHYQQAKDGRPPRGLSGVFNASAAMIERARAKLAERGIAA
jgi:hypothetical protein